MDSDFNFYDNYEDFFLVIWILTTYIIMNNKTVHSIGVAYIITVWICSQLTH